MRISDWSSDVCSSDQFGTRDIARMIEPGVGHMVEQSEGHFGRMFHQMIEGADPLIDRRSGLRKPGPEDVLQRRPRAVCPVSGDLDVAQPGQDQRDAPQDRQSTRLNSSHYSAPSMPSSASKKK